MRGRLAVGSLSVLLIVTSCGTDRTGSGATPTEVPRTQPSSPTVTPSAHPDRDPVALTNTLARINPCDLLKPVAGQPPMTLNGAATPFSCFTHSSNDPSVSGDDYSVGVALDVDRGRVSSGDKAAPLAGVHAYLERDDDRSSCDIRLPVSFTRAISYRAVDRRTGGDACKLARAYAAAGVALLAKPRLQPTRSWDACSAMSKALGEAIPLNTSELNYCPTREDGESLTLMYSAPDPQVSTRERIRIAGRTGKRVEDNRSCTIYWDQGPPGPGAHPKEVLTARVAAKTCERAISLATAVAAVMARPAPVSPVLTGPLTIPTTQPDRP